MLLSTHNSSYPSAVGLRRFLVGLTYAGVVLALFVVGSLAFFPQSAQPSAGKVLADGSLDLSSLNRAQAASRDNDNSDQLAAQLAQREQALNRLADLNAKRERVLSTPTSEFTMATFNVQGSSHLSLIHISRDHHQPRPAVHPGRGMGHHQGARRDDADATDHGSGGNQSRRRHQVAAPTQAGATAHR